MTLNPQVDSFLEKEILSVQKPLRYLGGEYLCASKPFFASPEEGLNIALAFPDTYEVGMSHLGLKILYALLNKSETFMCDRAFAPYPDMKALMEEKGVALFALESRRFLREFDVVGFSLQYELSFTTLLAMLKLSGITLKSSLRGEEEPVIAAGGPVASNPEPLADFIDLFFIGDAEESFPEALEVIRTGRCEKWSRRKIITEICRQVPGVYAPLLYRQTEADGRYYRLEPAEEGAPAAVKRRIADLDRFPVPDRVPVPHTEIVHNRISLEVMRGCSRGCRFCHAGFFYRPKRERQAAELCESAVSLLSATGFSAISLASLSTSDYSGVLSLSRSLGEYTRPRHIGTEIPSSRLDSLDEALLREISSVKRGGLTLAPEAGTQRLRDVINKNITEEDIRYSLAKARSLGWRSVKLYFMMGLPTETDEDLDGIVDLVNRLVREKWAVRVSLSVFVPKPHTPFQWEKPLCGEELSRRTSYVYNRIDRKAKVSWRSPLTALLEGLFSRGGRHLAPLLKAALEEGAYLDGWDEYFKKEAWKSLVERFVRVEEEMSELREDAPLPWDIIDIGVKKSYLSAERQKAARQETTPPCTEECRKCGVCDGEVRVREAEPHSQKGANAHGPARVSENRLKYRFWFRREGIMRFLSQKDLIQVIQASLMRAELPMLFSEGFSPRPRLSFCQPAPLGVAVENDFFEGELTASLQTDARALSGFFPRGMEITRIEEVTEGSKSSEFVLETVSVCATERRMERFSAPEWVYFDEKKEKYVTIKGLKEKAGDQGRLIVTYDNREASLKKVINYLLEGEEKPYPLNDIIRIGFHKGDAYEKINRH